MNKKDNPQYFKNQLINTDYIKCIPDYSVICFHNKNILCIGGGISVDRMIRQHTDSVRIVDYIERHCGDYKKAEENVISTYWENETVVYKPKVNTHIDIICSHVAPSFCYPIGIGSIVNDFAQYDTELLNNVTKERSILDRVYEDYRGEISHWYYGHYHENNMQIINNVCFKLLNIGKICRHYIDANNNDLL